MQQLFSARNRIIFVAIMGALIFFFSVNEMNSSNIARNSDNFGTLLAIIVGTTVAVVYSLMAIGRKEIKIDREGIDIGKKFSGPFKDLNNFELIRNADRNQPLKIYWDQIEKISFIRKQGHIRIQKKDARIKISFYTVGEETTVPYLTIKTRTKENFMVEIPAISENRMRKTITDLGKSNFL